MNPHIRPKTADPEVPHNQPRNRFGSGRPRRSTHHHCKLPCKPWQTWRHLHTTWKNKLSSLTPICWFLDCSQTQMSTMSCAMPAWV